MATQINSYNGGSVLPGTTVTKDLLRNLKLRHTKPNDSDVTDEEYDPLVGAIIEFQNLVFKRGNSILGKYDPLDDSETEVEIPSEVTMFGFNRSSGKMSGDSVAAMEQALSNHSQPFLVSQSGGTAQYWMLHSYSSAGYKFYCISDDGATLEKAVVSVSPDMNGDHTVTITQIRLDEVVYVGLNATYDQVAAIINSGGIPILKTVGGQGDWYFYPRWLGSRVDFVSADTDGIYKYAWTGGNWAYSEILFSDIEGNSYIKKVTCSNTGWLSNWASSKGCSFGDILGVVCDQGNNKNYYGSISAEVNDCGCVPCGFIIFLDETQNARKSDEARNYSVEVNLRLTTSTSYATEADALAALPDSMWLRVFSITEAGGATSHGPISCAKVYDNGVFVKLDTVHFDVGSGQTGGQWWASASALFQVCVVGNQWTFASFGDG